MNNESGRINQEELVSPGLYPELLMQNVNRMKI